MKTILDKADASAIVAKIRELKIEHEKMRVAHAMNKLSKVSEMRRVRGEIARNFTYLHQKGALDAFKRKPKKK